MKKIGVIGAGVIGLSWTALFISKGHEVYVFDILPDYQKLATQRLTQMLHSLNQSFDKVEHLVHFESALSSVAPHVSFIQECGPEDLSFKHNIFKELEALIDQEVIIASSSSTIIATQQATQMQYPERMIVGHPFNPPHLLPLVEVVPGEKTNSVTIEKTMAFYTEMGKKPVHIKKEITGFVANRLQFAMLQESMYLVEQGVVDAKELDTIMENSLGLRWATGGPFVSIHLTGGPAGIRGTLKHLGPVVNNGFKIAGKVELTQSLQNTLIQQIETLYGTNIEQLEQERDAKQADILNDLKKYL